MHLYSVLKTMKNAASEFVRTKFFDMHFFIYGSASYVAGKLYSFENFFLIISHLNSYEKNEI